MLLTITPPLDHKLPSSKNIYNSSPPSDSYYIHNKPTVHVSPLPPLQYGSPKASMSTPHRGLPPPAAMTLPDPTRQGPPPSMPPNMGHMPAPPQQWQGAEESMRNWLYAKAEEDKKRQEEERSRQEELRLEQRKIEQSILRESMSGGVPAHLVPVIFAGMGSGQLANVGLELAQQYLQQYQQAAQQQQHYVSEERNDPRHYADRNVQYIANQQHSQQHPPQPSPHGQPPAPPPQHANAYPSPAYHSPSQRSRGIYSSATHYTAPPPTSAPRSALPRLTTNEAQPQQAPPAGHPVPPGPSEQTEASPSIYFHHWQPPSNQTSGGSNKSKETGDQKSSPNLPSDPPSNKVSPRKRKGEDPHQPAPPPSNVSPAFSVTSTTSNKSRRTGHARNGSIDSNRAYDPIGRTNRPPAAREESSLESARADTSSKNSNSRQATPAQQGTPRQGTPRQSTPRQETPQRPTTHPQPPQPSVSEPTKTEQ